MFGSVLTYMFRLPPSPLAFFSLTILNSRLHHHKPRSHPLATEMSNISRSPSEILHTRLATSQWQSKADLLNAVYWELDAFPSDGKKSTGSFNKIETLLDQIDGCEDLSLPTISSVLSSAQQVIRALNFLVEMDPDSLLETKPKMAALTELRDLLVTLTEQTPSTIPAIIIDSTN